jgi:L-asparaginase
MRALPICQLIATGGTIAMRVDPARHAPVPALTGEELLHSVPGLAEVARLEVHEFSNLPSCQLDPQRWLALHAAVERALRRDDIAGVVVSHGTDALEETAWFLDLTVSGPKPVVLVGAQRNASEPDFDGPRNLLDGVRTSVCGQARGQGVLLVFNSRIHAARDVAKWHTSDVAAFASREAGLLGVVEGGRVVFSRTPTRRQHLALVSAVLPRVDIVAMYPGADGALLRAAAAAGARGIVVQALGAGNVNAEMHEAIGAAVRSGIAVVISTRVPHGSVRPLYGFPGGGCTLKEAGAIFCGDLSPQKARILLMLALQESRSPGEIQRLFDRQETCIDP